MLSHNSVSVWMQMLEAKSIALQQHQASASQQVKSLEERVSHEQMTVDALRRDVEDKEQQLSTTTQAHTDVRTAADWCLSVCLSVCL